VLAADLCLLMVERQEVAGLLGRFLEDDHRRASLQAIEDVVRKETFLEGATLASAVGDFLFRQHSYEAAYQAARFAEDLFRTAGVRVIPAGIDARMLIGRLWNFARLARISWRIRERRGMADRYLQDCLELLGAPALEPRTLPRLHSVEAFVLDVAASIDWARGFMETARQKIYRALFLLRGGTIHDSPRLAHALFTAGKIEATLASRSNARAAIEILNDAYKTFGAHPLAPMAKIQMAEAYLRTGGTTTARALLDEVKPFLREEVHKAEAALARSWIHARSSDWEATKQEAEGLLAQVRAHQELPARLEAEALLQLGRAQVHLAGSRDAGLANLNRAVKAADDNGRIKISIAALLELAAAYKDDPVQVEQAKEYWLHASNLLSRTRSAYLEELRDEVSRGLIVGWPFLVGSEDYENEKRKFAKEFFVRLYRRCNENMSETARRAGVARSTAIQILNGEPGEPLEARRPDEGRKRSKVLRDGGAKRRARHART
jgi:hypothetical protein